MESFMTGSRVYGMPREDSDVDLVCLVDIRDMHRLQAIADNEADPEYEGATTMSLRFGRLNLLCCSDAEDYRVWREGTDELIAKRPVTREEAIEVLQRRRDALQAERDAAYEAVVDIEF